jgi:dipeptidyl aminopeptidase/acylaminoacyl peptidase
MKSLLTYPLTVAWLGLALLTCAPTLLAQDSAWTVADIIQQASLSEATFTPDQSRLAWVKRRPSEEKNAFVTDLWLSYLDRPSPSEPGRFRSVQLTRDDKESDRNPVFSADGETLYYLSSAHQGQCLWALSLLGGAPYVVDSFDVSISGLKRLDDSTLLMTMEEGKTLREQELKKKKDDVVVVEDSAHVQADRVFAFDLKQKRRRRLTDNEFPLSEYAVSHDGRWLVTAHQLSPHYPADGKPKPHYYLWDLQAGSKVRILEGLQTPGSFQFARHDQGFFFSATQSSDPEWQGAGVEQLHYFALSSQRHERVDKADWGLGRGFMVSGNDAIASLAHGPTDILVLYRRQGDAWQQLPIDAGVWQEHLSLVALSDQADRALIEYSTASHPDEYVVVNLVEGKKGLTLTEKGKLPDVHANLRKKKLAATKVIHWRGANNEVVSGLLYYPHDYQAGQRYKLMVAIHGGPSGVDRDQWADRWAYPHNLLAQAGCLVLKPNYHGSSNHGQAFVESIKGHYYDLELPDILAGIDSLDQAGLILRDSMAVMGWSNGAILTTMLTVRYPDLFLAATPGAGDVNWTSDFGTCRFGVTFDQSYFLGAPWDDTDSTNYNPNYLVKSPLFDLERVKTPTLIFHGSEDRAVPRDQGWEYYRALQQVGEAPVRFLWFPGQPHGLQKVSHQTRKVAEEMDWLGRYFLGKAKADNEALKAGSPLAELLAQAKLARHNGMMGLMRNKQLLPQLDTVQADSIAISIFEVTNAQYQQYQPGHSFPLDQYNHPVVGLSREAVAGYLDWLAAASGWTTRLPNAAEAKALHQIARKAAPKENTLRYWAGYDLTLDDLPALRRKLAEVEPGLLLPVGHFTPVSVGQAKLYDVGGNAAEYSQTGRYGYSAYDLADPAEAAHDGSDSAVGFRVVVALRGKQ